MSGATEDWYHVTEVLFSHCNGLNCLCTSFTFLMSLETVGVNLKHQTRLNSNRSRDQLLITCFDTWQAISPQFYLCLMRQGYTVSHVPWLWCLLVKLHFAAWFTVLCFTATIHVQTERWVANLFFRFFSEIPIQLRQFCHKLTWTRHMN